MSIRADVADRKYIYRYINFNLDNDLVDLKTNKVIAYKEIYVIADNNEKAEKEILEETSNSKLPIDKCLYKLVSKEALSSQW